MSTEAATIQQQDTNLWDGGVSPFKVSYGKLMMWYFLLSDAFTFSGFLIAYGATRFSFETWPVPTEVFSAFPGFGHAYLPLMFVSIMTFILIMSSVTMVRAVQEGAQMNKGGVVKWMILTIIGGLAFLGCQAWEWTHLLTDEATNTIGTPWVDLAMYTNHTTHEVVVTTKQFSDLFFTITGFHGLHVTSGVIINIIILIQTMRGVYHRRGHYEMVEKVGLYWHFVDLVWVFVFLCFYLL